MKGVKKLMRTQNPPFQVFNQDFVKSSFSKNNPKTCVEVARKPEGVAIRDSKNPEGGVQYYSNEEWDAFIQGAKAGEFDSSR